jgi:hypothetical protein
MSRLAVQQRWYTYWRSLFQRIYELFIEVDMLEGHAPTDSVLEYVESYYLGNNPDGTIITVTFILDDEISNGALLSLGVDPTDGISETEFWIIETAYNDLGDDKVGARGPPYKFFSKWKWVLFGSTVEDEPDVVGFSYVVVRGFDLVVGNYIYIADETADDWASCTS